MPLSSDVIKASEYKKAEKVDELDGLIYFPSRPLQDGFAYIVEAKNYPRGESAAETQLQETCHFIDPSLKTDITKLSKCAYLRIFKTAE